MKTPPIRAVPENGRALIGCDQRLVAIGELCVSVCEDRHNNTNTSSTTWIARVVMIAVYMVDAATSPSVRRWWSSLSAVPRVLDLDD